MKTGTSKLMDSHLVDFTTNTVMTSNTTTYDELTIQPPSSFTFDLGNNPIIVINEEGFRYKGELIEDAGEVYELFKEFLKNAK
tara:strand:+ start:83 stop:331 length:249 start_codon:yes stop_codon:yes gene_type:complete